MKRKSRTNEEQEQISLIDEVMKKKIKNKKSRTNFNEVQEENQEQIDEVHQNKLSLNYQKLLKILKKQSGNQMAWKLLAAMKYLAKIKILIK